MKKYLIMLLAAAMGMLMLTACGDYDDDNNPGGTLGTTPSTPTGGLQSGLNGIGSDISKGLDEFGGAVSGAFTSMTNDSGISSVPPEPTMPTDTSDSMGTDVSQDPTNGADDNDVIPPENETETDNPNGGNAESPENGSSAKKSGSSEGSDSESSNSKSSNSKSSGSSSSSKK